MPKRNFVYLLILMLTLAACTRPAPATPQPTPTETLVSQGETDPYPAPETLTPPPTDTPFPTQGATSSPTSEPTQAQATEGATQAATATSAPATETPAATSTNTPTPTATLPPFNPKTSLGEPDFRDQMTANSDINWERDGEMPDTDNIRLRLEDDRLEVIGRRIQFDTWWFSWPTLADFFIQMEAETEDCGGKDAYGLILRGPPRDAGDTWGYIVAFSCDGHYLVRRVDSADPYQWVDLIPWTPSDHINTGPDEANRIGVELEGDTLTVYANHFQIAQIEDDNYDEGRIGVFVNAGQTVNFRYYVDELSYWEFD